METPAATSAHRPVPSLRPVRPTAHGAAAVVGLVATLAVAGCGAGIQAETSRERPTITSVGGAVGDITLRNVYVGGPGVQGGSVPVLFAAFTGGTAPDRLTGISSPVATGVSAPAQVDVPVADGRYYNPGSSTPRLTGLKAPLRVGQQVELVLQFERSGSVTLQVPVDAVPSADLSASPSASASASPSASASAKASATPSPSASPSASATPSP